MHEFAASESIVLVGIDIIENEDNILADEHPLKETFEVPFGMAEKVGRK